MKRSTTIGNDAIPEELKRQVEVNRAAYLRFKKDEEEYNADPIITGELPKLTDEFLRALNRAKPFRGSKLDELVENTKGKVDELNKYFIFFGIQPRGKGAPKKQPDHIDNERPETSLLRALSAHWVRSGRKATLPKSGGGLRLNPFGRYVEAATDGLGISMASLQKIAQTDPYLRGDREINPKQ